MKSLLVIVFRRLWILQTSCVGSKEKLLNLERKELRMKNKYTFTYIIFRKTMLKKEPCAPYVAGHDQVAAATILA
jgi:hypothetical protein